MKINDLQKQICTLKNVVENQLRPCNGVASVFSTAQREELQRIPNDKGSDTAFVRKALILMYSDDMSRLRLKSISGRKTRPYVLKNGECVNHERKEPLSPEKLDKLKQLYCQRVVEADRKKMFNRNVSAALEQIKKQIDRQNMRVVNNTTANAE